jgi:hypothetical protein
VDDIDSNGVIIVKVKSLEPGKHDTVNVPPAPKGMVRVDFDAGIVIRACPPDHPMLVNRKKHSSTTEPLLLVSLTQTADAHVGMIPHNLINFCTRTVIGGMWSKLLHVAQDIRNGKRQDHLQAIENKRDLYEWVEQRVSIMLTSMSEERASTVP